MSTSQVNISCQHLMSIFQLDFPFLMPSISQYLEFNIYDCYFWVGFPVSAVKYFSKLKFCIYDCTFGLDFPFLLLSISQNWNSALLFFGERLEEGMFSKPCSSTFIGKWNRAANKFFFGQIWAVSAVKTLGIFACLH